jgi:hypothetical protein
MDDYWPSNRCSWSSEQWRKALLNPCKCSPIGLLGTRKILEDTDRSHGVVGCINYIVGHKASTSLMIGMAPSLILRVNSSAIPAFALP